MKNLYSALKKARAEYQAVDLGTTISEKWMALKLLNRSGLGRKEKADILLHVNNVLEPEAISQFMELKYGKHHLEDTKVGLRTIKQGRTLPTA